MNKPVSTKCHETTTANRVSERRSVAGTMMANLETAQRLRKLAESIADRIRGEQPMPSGGPCPPNPGTILSIAIETEEALSAIAVALEEISQEFTG